MNMPTPIFFCNQSEDYCQNKKIPAKSNTISATINTIHQRYTSQFGAPTYPFLQIVIAAACAAAVVTKTTDRDSSRYTYNGIRRVRQLALGCESN